MTSKFVEIIPPYHRRGNCIPFAAIRWPDFGVDLDRLNGLLAATGNPLATKTEIDIWYGRKLSARQRN